MTGNTNLPYGLYLLDESDFTYDLTLDGLDLAIGLKPLEFMEAHADKLNCLAWPIAQFFSNKHNPDISTRARSVIEKLGRSLVDLRVDEWYYRHPETNSEEDVVLSPGRKRSEYFFPIQSYFYNR